MEKCFDRIEYSAIYGALRFFNFGEHFIQWVSLFYTEFVVCTQNFGHCSAFFIKTRSVNQGCNISPSKFLLVDEILALWLKCNPNIQGLKVGDTEILISQFADDMDLYLPFDKFVVDTVMDTLSDVEKNTGLKVFYEKSTLYRIGSIQNCNTRFYTKRPINWTKEPIYTLGVELRHDDLSKNYDNILLKMQTIANTWQYRNLTLMGKILIVNTLISSLFVYKMQVLPMCPEKIIESIESEIQKFLWKGKRAKISFEILKCSKDMGGLGLVDIRAKQISLMLKWVKISYKNNIIQSLMYSFLEHAPRCVDIWEANLRPKDIGQT